MSISYGIGLAGIVPPGVRGEFLNPVEDLGMCIQKQLGVGDFFVRELFLPGVRLSLADDPVTDAMVGTSIAVPTVDGEAELELRPGTQSGDELVMRGRGFPALAGRGRGSQRVIVDVRVPRVLTEDGRRAVEGLAETLDERAYREDEGFFDRLKHAFR